MFEKTEIRKIALVDRAIHSKNCSVVDSGERRGVYKEGRTIGFVRVHRLGTPTVFFEEGYHPFMEGIRREIQRDYTVRYVEIRPSDSPKATEAHWSDFLRATQV